MALDVVTISGTYRHHLAVVTFKRDGKKWKAFVIVGLENYEYSLPESTRPGMTVATRLVKESLGIKSARREKRPMLRIAAE